MNDKVNYVRNAAFSKGHKCHWPGCTKEVKPAYWGCVPHWYSLPKELRAKIWAAYRPSQEISKRVSVKYIGVMVEVQQWFISQEYVESQAKADPPL